MTTKSSNPFATTVAQLFYSRYPDVEFRGDGIVFYSVIRNDGSKYRLLTVVPNANFKTLEEANSFRESVLDQYPLCRVSLCVYTPEEISQYDEAIQILFQGCNVRRVS